MQKEKELFIEKLKFAGKKNRKTRPEFHRRYNVYLEYVLSAPRKIKSIKESVNSAKKHVEKAQARKFRIRP